ncbi:MAG: aldehyde ferredoxin oxidoreductase N-terminal domain-containing protein, partial [Candidatus Odinarchaeia archaeon]
MNQQQYRILHLNLSNKSQKSIQIDKKILFEYLGGRGLGIYNLYQKVSPQINPFNPLSTFYLFGGLLTKSRFLGANRFGVFSKSPLTGIFAEEYSYGNIAICLANLGYIGLCIEGSSDQPIWIKITNDTVEFNRADEIWGFTASETIEFIKHELSSENYGVVLIGPAGENLVRFSSLITESNNMVSGCGSGAIFGSKKLKCLVVESKCELEVNRELEDLENTIINRIKEKQENSDFYRYGDLSFIDIANNLGVFPTRYWKFGFSEEYTNFNLDKILSCNFITKTGCDNCPIKCKYLASDTPIKTLFELNYEAVSAFGGFCDINELDKIIKLTGLCYEMGVSLSNMGNVLSFALDCIRSNIIETDKRFEYGEFDSLYELAKEICYRNDIGSYFSDGVRMAAKKTGYKGVEITIKKLEPFGLDPRGLHGTA